MIRYRNKNTGQVVPYAEAQPGLENLPQWEVVKGGGDDDAVWQEALDRATAEKRSIEDAEARRLQDAKKFHADAVETATAAAQSIEGGAVNVTLASHTAESPHFEEGVLSRLQLPGTPSPEELEARAQADSDAIHALGDDGGVLARAHADAEAGLLQIGDNPEEHPKGTDELEAKAQEDSDKIAASPDEGVLARAGEGLASTEDAAASSAGPVKDKPVKPAKNGKHESWVDWAVSQGADRDEADGLSRDELVERYG